MKGVITKSEVLVYTFTILRHFGIKTWWRVTRAALSRRECTFLEVLWSD